MKTFLDYVKLTPDDILSEAYTPIAREKFTSKQLKEIGDFLAKHNGVGIQGSDVQHWKAKDFRWKMAVPNSIAICKLKDGNYVILVVQNQQKITIIKNTSPTQYETGKGVLSDSTDVFTFNSVDMVYRLQTNRYNSQDYRDPLIAKHNEFRNRLRTAKQEKQNYVANLNKALANTGITIDELYYEEDNGVKILRGEVDKDYSKFKYTDVNVYVFSNPKNPELQYEFRTQGRTYKTERDFEECIEEIKRVSKIFKIIDKIDYSKIPVVKE